MASDISLGSLILVHFKTIIWKLNIPVKQAYNQKTPNYRLNNNKMQFQTIIFGLNYTAICRNNKSLKGEPE